MHEIIVVCVCVSLLLLPYCMSVAIGRDDWTKGIAQLSIVFPNRINISKLELKFLLFIVKTRFFTFVNEVSLFLKKKA